MEGKEAKCKMPSPWHMHSHVQSGVACGFHFVQKVCEREKWLYPNYFSFLFHFSPVAILNPICFLPALKNPHSFFILFFIVHFSTHFTAHLFCHLYTLRMKWQMVSRATAFFKQKLWLLKLLFSTLLKSRDTSSEIGRPLLTFPSCIPAETVSPDN